MRIKKIIISILALSAIVLVGCTKEETKVNSYQQITANKAKEIMDKEEEYIILDVREQNEYDEGHIPGAILLPYKQVDELASELLPDKDQLILVYCRSGNRSKKASQSLVDLGYSNIVEFGGIIDWPYNIEQ